MANILPGDEAPATLPGEAYADCTRPLLPIVTKAPASIIAMPAIKSICLSVHVSIYII